MSTIMVDTIHFSVKLALPVFLGDPLGWTPGGKIAQGWKIIDKEIRKTKYINKAKVTVKFLEENYQGESQMNIYVSSLPKTNSDNNFENSTNFPQDFVQLGQLIQERFMLPEFNILKATVFRLDSSTVFPLGELVPTYLEIIRQLHHPYRDRHTYCNSNGSIENGVEFFTGERLVTSKFYDKFMECHDDRAKGLLRYEVSITHSDNLKNYISTPALLVGDINNQLLCQILNDDIKMIGLDKPQKNYDCLVESLLAKEYKKYDEVIQYLAIYRFLCANWEKTDSFLATLLGRDARTIRERRNKVRSFGGPFLKFGKGITELPGLLVQ
jgi:hypothetical protein